MPDFHKDVLLIGDTFVYNLQEKKTTGDDIEYIENFKAEYAKKTIYANSFFKAFKEKFSNYKLSSEIDNLLNNSINPAVLHLASVLSRKGYSYDTIDCSLKHYEKLIAYLKSTNYRIIGISTTFTLEKAYLVYLVNLIKKYTPAIKIMMGGMFIVKLFKLRKNEELDNELKAINADYYIFNEIGEQALTDILKHELDTIPCIDKAVNVAYKADREYKINPYIVNDINISVSDWTLSKNTTYAFLRTSISCLYKCKFCTYPAIADKYKSKSIEIIRQEFDQIKKAGIKYIRFLDDTFNFPKSHSNKIINELSIGQYEFQWVAYLRCQHMDESTASLMKKSNCIGVFLGLESGSNRILKNMNKGATIEQYHDGIALLHKYDIPAYGTFITGFPGETAETVNETIDFINKSGIQYFRVFSWIYHDLAPISQEKQKYSIIVESEEKWRHSSMNSIEAIDQCKHILHSVKNSIHCTVPFDYAFYLNSRPDTQSLFNESLKSFNQAV